MKFEYLHKASFKSITKYPTMKYIILLTCFYVIALHTFGENIPTQITYKNLDIAIANSQFYINNKRNAIKMLRSRIRNYMGLNRQFNIYFSLYRNYQTFQNDSALYYLSRCISIAEKINDPAKKAECEVLSALQCSKTGMYAEALSYLQNLRRSDLDKNGIKDFYFTMNHLYGEMGSYSKIPSKGSLFFKISDSYRDSMYHVFSPTSETYLMKKGEEMINAGQYNKALKYNNKGLQEVKRGTHVYAIVAYYRYLIFKGLGKQQKALYWLTESAISDIKNATMDQASLWTLASLLSKKGDIKRSYKYVTIAWKDANIFGTRVRNWQISPVLNTITNSYEGKLQQRNNILVFLVIVVSLLAFTLLMLVYYVKRQNRKLYTAQQDQKKKNRELEEMNQELEDLNKEQKNLLNELSISNKKLNESNSVKEEYIGQFLELCSYYIDKMEKFRYQINKMVRNNQKEKLLNLTNGIEMEDQALDQLLRKFDAAFLHLFPNFIEDLNGLIVKEHHFKLNDNKKFSTPLRIMALIRLGIDDSPKIANLLHHSITTIYNYRVKYRNWALGDRENFEKRVKEIDMPIPFKDRNGKDTPTTE